MQTDKNREQTKTQSPTSDRQRTANNPFENGQPVNDEKQQAKEELEKEQTFKEAQTERD